MERSSLRGARRCSRLAGATVLAAVAAAAAAARADGRPGVVVVAPERVSIGVRPTVLGSGEPIVTVFGSIASRRAGEVVTIQAKDCAQQFFRAVAQATTREGGEWQTAYAPGIATTIRAVWGDSTSTSVTIRHRASVTLIPRGSTRRFWVAVGGRTQFWRRRVLVQRFEPRFDTWRTVKPVVLTDVGGPTPDRARS